MFDRVVNMLQLCLFPVHSYPRIRKKLSKEVRYLGPNVLMTVLMIFLFLFCLVFVAMLL